MWRRSWKLEIVGLLQHNWPLITWLSSNFVSFIVFFFDFNLTLLCDVQWMFVGFAIEILSVHVSDSMDLWKEVTFIYSLLLDIIASRFTNYHFDSNKTFGNVRYQNFKLNFEFRIRTLHVNAVKHRIMLIV